MNNYKQKIFLLCALLIGCVLTSIGIESFSKTDEQTQIPNTVFKEQHIVKNKSEASNFQESELEKLWKPRAIPLLCNAW